MFRTYRLSRSAHVALLGAFVGGLAQTSLAQASTPRDRVAAPLPHMLDVKTAPPAPLAPDDDGLEVRPSPLAPTIAPPKSEEVGARLRPARPIDFTHVYFDEAENGALWAMGETYKASFAAGRFTYIPFFGSKAPRNFPVAVSLESARVGGLDVVAGVASAPERAGDRVVIERGGVVELFDLDPRSVKQEFVFDSLPRHGDLRLRLAVETELAPRSSGAGVEFGNDLGFVSYSQALALDAAGARTSLATSWVDGAIEIVVPQEFLATARFPLSIDPLFTTYTVDATAEDDSSPDIAFENTAFIFAVCWQRVFSLGDNDVWVEQYSVGGSPVASSRLSIDFSSENWERPRIASHVLAGQFLVVAAVGSTLGGARTIRGRTIESESPYTRGAKFTISGSETGDKFDPDVGGDPSGFSPSYYCVVWTRAASATDHDVHARLVQSDSTLLGSSTIFLDNSASTLDHRATVSKSNGPPPSSLQDWNIAWEREVVGPHGDIRAAQIHWDGTITTSPFGVVTASSNDESPSASPGIDIGGVRYYGIAFTRDFTSDHDIELSVLTGSTLLSTTNVSGLENTFSPGLLLLDQIEPTIDASSELFHIACAEESASSATNYDIVQSTLAFNGATSVLAEAHLGLASSATSERAPQITSRRSGGLPTSVTLACTWEEASAANFGDIEAAVTTIPTGGPVQILCSGDGSSTACPCGAGAFQNGCPNSLFAGGAALRAVGSANVSSDTLVLQGTQMPNSTAVYFQGTSSVSSFVIDDGIMCTGGTIIRLGSKLNSANASQYPAPGDASISVRGAIPAAAGVTRMYQAFYRNAATFCTPSTSNRTNALRVTWIP